MLSSWSNKLGNPSKIEKGKALEHYSWINHKTTWTSDWVSVWFVMEPSNATKHSTEILHSICFKNRKQEKRGNAFAFLEVENFLLFPFAIYPSVPLCHRSSLVHHHHQLHYYLHRYTTTIATTLSFTPPLTSPPPPQPPCLYKISMILHASQTTLCFWITFRFNQRKTVVFSGKYFLKFST